MNRGVHALHDALAAPLTHASSSRVIGGMAITMVVAAPVGSCLPMSYVLNLVLQVQLYEVMRERGGI